MADSVEVMRFRFTYMADRAQDTSHGVKNLTTYPVADAKLECECGRMFQSRSMPTLWNAWMDHNRDHRWEP